MAGVLCGARNQSRVSTPGHPQQNSMLERYMQIINKAITVALSTREDPESSIAKSVETHNTAAHRITGKAPEVLMFGRLRRSHLPVAGDSRFRIDRTAIRNRDESEKEKYKHKENEKRGAKATGIDSGDTVLVKRHLKTKDQTKFLHTPFKVTKITKGDCKLVGPDGQNLKRNVIQLRKVGPDYKPPGSQPPTTQPRQPRTARKPAHLSDYVL